MLRTWSPEFKGVGAARTGAAPQVDYMQEALSYVASKAKSDPTIFTGTEEVVVPKLQDAYGSLGFIFEQTGYGRDQVKVTAPDGATMTFEADESRDNAIAQLDALQSFINGKLTKEGAETAFKAGNVRGSGGNSGELD